MHDKGVHRIIDAQVKLVDFTDGYMKRQLTIVIISKEGQMFVPNQEGSMLTLTPASKWLSEGVKKHLPKRGRPKKAKEEAQIPAA